MRQQRASGAPNRRPILLRLLTPFLLVCTLLPVGVTVASGAPGPDATEKIKPKLAAQLEDQGRATFWVRFEQADLSAASTIKDWTKRGQAVYDALTAKADASQRETKALLDKQGVSYQAYYGTNAIRVEKGDSELALQIAAASQVDSIWPGFDYDLEKPTQGEDQHEVNAVEWGIANINADDVWSQYGVTGEDVVIANIDTGVQFDHPALVNQYRGNNGDGTFTHDYNWFNAAGTCATAPCDGNGHGTHTMGTMLGNDGGANQIGVAPGAKWIAANGCCPTDAALIASGEWMLAPKNLTGQNPDVTKRPNIINNSWGTTQPTNDPFMEDIQLAWAASGIWGQWSNGNSGPNCSTSGSPGSRIINYSAGAYDINNTIASFSARGAGQDGEIKPNISAPGVNVRSSIPGGGYTSFNGTSMASPHVAGTVALLWSAAPALVGDIEGTRALLDGSAVDTENTTCGGTADDNNVYGEGRLDALALLNSAPVGAAGTIAGTVTDAATGAPIGGAQVTVDGEHDRTVTAAADGTYSTRVSTGDYQVSARAFGYLASTPVGATVTADATTSVDVALQTAPRHTVSGTVTDAGTGEALAGYRVSISAPIDPVTSGADGTFSFADVPEGTYTITVGGGSCTAPFSTEVVVDGDETVNAQISRRFDEYGYYCSVGNSGVRTGETRVNLTGDDAAATVPMPFSFPFYEGEFATAYVSTNGHVNFRGTSTTLANKQIPDSALPHSAIYGLWDDLYFDANSGLYTATTQVDGVDAFVLEWRDVAFFSSKTTRTNFSVTLLANGQVELGYGANSGGLATGTSATIGIENTDSTIASQFSFNTAAVTPGLSVRYASAPRGTVAGTVTDRNTGQPLAGASVTVSGDNGEKTVTTGADGTYSASMRTGDYTVEIAAENYVSATESVTIAEDATSTFDAALAAGKITMTSDGDTHANLRMGGSATEEITVTNEGSAPASVDLSAGGGEFVPLSGGALTGVQGKASVPSSVAPKRTAAKGSSLSGSGATFEKVTPAATPVPADQVTITHSASQAIVPGSAACGNTGGTVDNGYLRTFTLSDFGLNGLDVTNVSFGVETNGGSQPLTVNLYTLDGDLRYANMTLIGSADATVPAGQGMMVNVPVEGSVPSGGTLVVEVDLPTGGRFYIGSNGEGQTAPSYLRSATCGISEPADTGSVGFPDMHIVMNVTGESGGAPADWVSFDNPSFTLEPGQSVTVGATMSADVDQPGAYSALIGAATNTPYAVAEVPVSMDVTAPRTWGKITGKVTAADGTPLDGAIVQLNGGHGYHKTLVTGSDGTYSYWIDTASNPLEVVVSVEGYVPETATVRLKAGGTVRTDFQLDPLP